MKKVISLLLAFCMLLCMPGCGQNKTEDRIFLKEVMQYGGTSVDYDLKLPGMSDSRAVVLSEEDFDPALITAGNAALFDDTLNEVIYAKNATEKLYPASITKCMTALLVLENVDDLTREITVGEEMFSGLTEHSSSAGLQVGDRMSVKDLLAGLIIPSGNDAANVLANYVAGSVPAFVEMMNEKAHELGMLNTHFMNPHGLHDRDHYTTVYDLYLLMHECLQYDYFRELSGAERKEVKILHANEETEKRTYTSGNSFLRRFTEVPDGFYIIGGKTGYTEKAGRCLLFAVTGKDHHTYISVVCHAVGYDTLYQETNTVLLQAPLE